MTDPEAGAAALERRRAADRQLAEQGADVYRHVVGMLGEERATEVFVPLFDYVEQHLAEPSEPSALRAMVYNRCIEHARSRGDRPVGDVSSEDERRVMRAFGRLKPVGRDALLRRVVAGTRWDELQRICGVSRARMHMRVCRALRRMASLDGLPRVESERDVADSSASAKSEVGWQWPAIRRSAADFVALRSVLRRVCDRWATPPDGWRAEIWERLDREREAERRAAEPDPPVAAEADETSSPELENAEPGAAEPETAEPETAEPETAEPTGPRPERSGTPTPPPAPGGMSPTTWRLLAGLVMALGGLMIWWLSTR